MASGTAVYRLTFTREMLDAPILQNAGKRFRVTLAIRRAMLSEEGGWAEIEVSGPTEEIGRVVADLHTTGVSVTGPLSPEDDVQPLGGSRIVTAPRGT